MDNINQTLEDNKYGKYLRSSYLSVVISTSIRIEMLKGYCYPPLTLSRGIMGKRGIILDLDSKRLSVNLDSVCSVCSAFDVIPPLFHAEIGTNGSVE